MQTWRDDYPYEQRMSREEYELEKYRLQIELLKFQHWGQDHGVKVVFEGRDAAGKGGTSKRFTEHLDPRSARTVALIKPSERSLGAGNGELTELLPAMHGKSQTNHNGRTSTPN